jgi:hypothetical protein
MPVPAVFESLGIRAAWSGATAWISKLKAGKIQITSPRPQEALGGRQTLPDGGITYEVRGKLKSLQQSHEIWLLLQEQTTGDLWPQGSHLVQFDPVAGEWVGRVSDRRSNHPIKIVAVVAPPSSQDFFRYYEKVGRKAGYEPLSRIPPECTNQASIQARLP